MAEAVICEPLRTPVGTLRWRAVRRATHTLAAGLIRELARRNGLSGDDIDDVVLGQGSPNGEAPAIGRVAALDAGLGTSVPGQQVDRRCGAGLQAVLTACMQVATGAADLVLAGGAESMSQTEFAATGLRWGSRRSRCRWSTGSRGPGSPRAGRFSRFRVGWSRRLRTCGPNWTSVERTRTRSRCSPPASGGGSAFRSVRAGDRPGRGSPAPG